MSKHYYHLADLQNGGQIMGTGKNAESLEELHEALLSYISVDYPSEKPEAEKDTQEWQEWADWQTIQKLSANELAEIWGFKIKWTERKINNH